MFVPVFCFYSKGGDLSVKFFSELNFETYSQ
jgi:hypothetical protein